MGLFNFAMNMGKKLFGSETGQKGQVKIHSFLFDLAALIILPTVVKCRSK